MTTPPRGEADEPAPIRETGVGWPDQLPPPRTAPAPRPAAKPAPTSDTTTELPRRTMAAAPTPDSEFADAVRKYRASTSPSSVRSARSYQMVPQRPGTVTAAAVIMFVSAGLGLLACCGINLLAGEASLGDDEQTVLLIFSAVIVVFSAFNGLLGYFILQGRQWARITTIVLCALGIAGSVVGLIAGAGSTEDGGSNALSTCFGLVLNIVIIVLLSGQQASDYFRSARGG